MNFVDLFIKKVVLTFKRPQSYLNRKRLKRDVLNYYSNKPTNDNEINSALVYIRNHNVTTFPYPFNDKYTLKNISIYKDHSNGFHYILRNDKKLYLRKDITHKTMRNMYNSLLVEQDSESAHRYLTKDFNITENDVLIDIGCAEAFLVLDSIENIKRAYLFEYEEEWIEALKLTFAPWIEKVEIIKKYVSNYTNENCITIDDFLKDKEDMPTFIKIDVEGAEIAVLDGMKQTLSSNNIKLAVCTYHKCDDYENITGYISNMGMKYVTSKNYMLSDIKPYFRRGLIRAIK